MHHAPTIPSRAANTHPVTPNSSTRVPVGQLHTRTARQVEQRRSTSRDRTCSLCIAQTCPVAPDRRRTYAKWAPSTSSSSNSTPSLTMVAPTFVPSNPLSITDFTPLHAPSCRRRPPRRRPPHLARPQMPSMQLGAPSTQIGRPKTSIKKDVGRMTEPASQPEADTDKGSAKARPRRKTQADEVPMYKVILLGDEEYVEAHVVTQLQKTVQLDKKEATRIFREAQQTGSSIVCVVCEEHAEFYALQLKRQDIFVMVEKDE